MIGIIMKYEVESTKSLGRYSKDSKGSYKP